MSAEEAQNVQKERTKTDVQDGLFKKENGTQKTANGNGEQESDT